MFPRLFLSFLFTYSYLSAEPGLRFEENRGQTDPFVQYLARTRNGVLYATRDGLAIDRPGSSHRFGLRVVGTQSGDSHWQASGPTQDRTSYFLGRDPSRWVKDVTQFTHLRRPGVLPGVDWVVYGNGAALEYDFVLAPGADVAGIVVEITGAERISLDTGGDLILRDEAGEVRKRRPVVYQVAADGSRQAVEGAFRILGRSQLGFVVGNYDRRRELVIDPEIVFSTYFGGPDSSVFQDGEWLVGSTSAVDFTGIDLGRRRGRDIFVQSRSQTMVIGGAGDDQVLATGLAGSYLLIGGRTTSRDFPIDVRLNPNVPPSPAWQPEFAGGTTDGFLIRVKRGFASMEFFVTYLGTDGDDQVTGLTRSFLGSAAVGTTTGRGLPSPDGGAVHVGVRAETASAVDGFVVAFSESGTGLSLRTTAYLGGSGNDTPLSVSVSPTDGSILVGGETNSPDFPGLSGAISGSSDAFLTRWQWKNLQLELARSVVFGGREADRVTQLTGTPGAVLWAAGVTASADFPVLGGWQMALGGQTDSFLMRWRDDLSAFSWSTFWGGAGADEITAMVSDEFGVYAAGNTSSHDMSTRNAIQPGYGGGASDGFVLAMGLDGNMLLATYYGGSGEDRVQSLAASNGMATIAGSTTSTDLPLVRADRPERKSPSDGFLATLATTPLLIPPVQGAKQLRVEAYFRTSVATAALPLTVSSSDPGTVLLSATADGNRAPSVTIAAGDPLFVDCLQDSGGADLRVESPGIPPYQSRVTCSPAYLSVSISTEQIMSLWENPLRIFVTLRAADRTAFVSPQEEPVVVDVANSNPEVLSVSDTSVTIPARQFGAASLVLTQKQIGGTTLRVTCRQSRCNQTAPATVRVVSPFLLENATAVNGFLTYLSTQFRGFPRGRIPDLVWTSQDPSRLLFGGLTPETGGQASITFAPTANSVQTLLAARAATGDVAVKWTFGELGEGTFTVQLAEPRLSGPRKSDGSLISTLRVGEKLRATVAVGASRGFAILTPGVPGITPSVVFENTADDVVSVSAAEPTGGVASYTFELVARKQGSATITWKFSDGAGQLVVPIRVVAGVPLLDDLELGKDLAAAMTVRLPYVLLSATKYTVRSSRPELVRLRGIGSDSRIEGTAGTTDSIEFSVEGLAAQGSSTITVEVEGVGDAQANVLLRPSGFCWTGESVSAVPDQGLTPAVPIQAYALDAASLTPLVRQNLRPGVRPSVLLESNDPRVVSVPGTFALQDSTPRVTVGSAGVARVKVISPEGFTTPSVGTILWFRVSPDK